MPKLRFVSQSSFSKVTTVTISIPPLVLFYLFAAKIVFANIKAKKLLSFFLDNGEDNDMKSSIGSYISVVF